ncbi:hypothetical protein CPB85DRAFT_1184606, partial [Mucidula mucida]
ITPAYAFTDYCLQEQTILSVMVDLAKPPSGRLSLFNMYVALSRKLMQEDDRLKRLNETTRIGWDKI